MKIFFKTFFVVFIGLIAFYLAFKNVDYEQSLKAYQNTSLGLQVAVFLCFFLTHILRTLRWKYLQEDLNDVPVLDVYAIHSIGFLGIFILPFRLGELVRPGLLKKKYATPISKTVTYVFIERIWDGIVVCGLFFLGVEMSLKQGLILSSEQSAKIAFYLNNGLLLFLGLSMFLLLATWVIQKKQHKLTKYFFWNRYGQHILKALAIVLSSKKSLIVFFYSVLIWVSAVGGYWLMFKAYQFPLGFFAAMSVLGLLSLGLMIPGPPGFIGTFHFFIQISLAIFLIDVNHAIAYASSLYLINGCYIILSGLWGSWYMSIKIKEIKNLTRS
ncbi:MAG TPA: lysylphosphatidylglycerol synthase transmembrane domain-containing protein [Oligoflexia bacterium]|nr:lysylphosphatidylglycerol synthase transmembrane domain-containing protein [Oligoflexia bacterium]HMR25323.1 lysylphosphatidylglycerol synthase transmembrane domain-containing protein [Oligoflexia bacterium]